ncbi:TPA: hypothetical protein DCZ39_03010 [Patescibacteria group bacterium]|nr:hypothetical protein [Candidatus Gracilibacteria bacterium]
MDVLLLLQKDFIQEIRKCYCEHSDTKLLLEIPELKDIKINVAEIAPNGFSTMHISTSFK